MRAVEELEVDDTRALRARRLFQVSSLALGALTIAALGYLLKERWNIVGILSIGIVMMLICQQLSRKGHTEAGNLVLLLSVTAVMSTLMWTSEGLRDAAFLSFPVILIMAGLLVRPWQFFAILICMLVFMVVLTLSTAWWGIRTDTSVSTPFELSLIHI